MRTLNLIRSSRGRWTRERQVLVLAVAMIGLVVGYAAFGGGAPAAAQSRPRAESLQGTASLTGTVDAAKPFKAAQVYIRNMDTRMLYMVFTAAGKFRAVALLPGNYEINVQARGLESDVQKLVVKAGDRPDMKLSMHDAANAGRFPSGSPAPDRGVTLLSYDEVYPPGPGRQVMEEVCMVCHGENYFSLRGRNEAGWQAAIDLMMGKNAFDRDRVNSAEGILAPPASGFRFGVQDRKDVLEYLNKNFGPDSKPRAVRWTAMCRSTRPSSGRRSSSRTSSSRTRQVRRRLASSRRVRSPFRRNRIMYTAQLDAEGNVWGVDRGDPNRLVKLNPRTGAQKDFVLPDPKAGVHELVIDRDGMIWVPEIGGQPRTREYRLLGFNPKTEKWEQFRSTPIPTTSSATRTRSGCTARPSTPRAIST